MRVLLFGEYSRFHNTLKEGLEALGHNVLLVGNNDFKNYPLDLSFYARLCKDYYLLNKIRQVIFRLTKLDIAEWETAFRFYLNRKKCTGFDVVQLVNEYPIGSAHYLEVKILKYIFNNNRKVFVSACGDDYISVMYMLARKFRYSTMTPCMDNPGLGHCRYSYLYVTKPFIKLHEFVYKNVAAVIPGDLDYAIPWAGDPKATELVPYPINTDKIQVIPMECDVVTIFHGINEINYYKKGNSYFEKALEIIQQEFGPRVKIIQVRSIPYEKYITLYNSCDILLDQVLSYDQGYNALEAMAQGKVVFTGAEEEFTRHFNLQERVAINALPDVDSIVSELRFLIENPSEVKKIGRNARKFVEQYHDYKKIAADYLKIWEQT